MQFAHFHLWNLKCGILWCTLKMSTDKKIKWCSQSFRIQCFYSVPSTQKRGGRKGKCLQTLTPSSHVLGIEDAWNGRWVLHFWWVVRWMKFQCWGPGKTMVSHTQKRKLQGGNVSWRDNFLVKYALFEVPMGTEVEVLMEEKCGPPTETVESHRVMIQPLWLDELQWEESTVKERRAEAKHGNLGNAHSWGTGGEPGHYGY